MSELIIETRNLSKVFGSKTIVSDINISIEKGSIYGFLGAIRLSIILIFRIILKFPELRNCSIVLSL
jgi:ABC-type uncharacterized transport system ATPase subunit